MENSLTTHEFWIHSGIFVRLIVLVLIVAILQLWFIMRRLETKFEKLRQITDAWPPEMPPDTERATNQKGVVTMTGRKTYVVAAFLFLAALMQTLGWLSREAFETLGVLLISLGLASLRAGVAKIRVKEC